MVPIIRTLKLGKSLYINIELKKIIMLIVSPSEYIDPNQKGKAIKLNVEKITTF